MAAFETIGQTIGQESALSVNKAARTPLALQAGNADPDRPTNRPEATHEEA